MSEPKVRRAIKLEGTDQIFEISKAAGVKTNGFLMHLDLLDDGTVRLLFNSNLIPDFTKIAGITVIREN